MEQLNSSQEEQELKLIEKKQKYEKPEITIQMPMETRTGSDCPS